MNEKIKKYIERGFWFGAGCLFASVLYILTIFIVIVIHVTN